MAGGASLLVGGGAAQSAAPGANAASVPTTDNVPPPAPLWRDGDFLRFWVGETLSLYGTQVTVMALPLTAVVKLGAGPEELGLLRFLQLVPYLGLSLLFGVWVDRARRRPLMIGANAVRCALLALVPALWLVGLLTSAWLLAIAFLVGVASVLFDVSWMSYVPVLVRDKRRLVDANTKLAVTASSADVAGPGVAGVIITVVTAPFAIVLDAASYVASVVLLLLIRTPEVRPAVSPERRHLRRELAEGLRWVIGDRYLRAVAVVGFACNFMLMFTSSLFLLYAVRERHLSPAMLGLVFSLGGVGGLLGSMIAGPAMRRARLGRIYATAMAAVFLSPALVPMASGSKAMVAAMFVTWYFVGNLGLGVANVLVVTLRQTVTPHSLMGRMSAAMRMMLFGGGALGGLTSGFVGSAAGPRHALVLGAIVSASIIGPIALSPVARLRELPAPVDTVAGRP